MGSSPCTAQDKLCDLRVFTPAVVNSAITKASHAKAHASVVPQNPLCQAPTRNRPQGPSWGRGQMSSSVVLPHVGFAYLTSGWIKAKLPSTLGL